MRVTANNNDVSQMGEAGQAFARLGWSESLV